MAAKVSSASSEEVKDFLSSLNTAQLASLQGVIKDSAPVTAIVTKESEETPKPDVALDEATEHKIKTLFDAIARGHGQISIIDLVKYCRANDEFVSTFGLDKDADGKIRAVDKAGLIDFFQGMDGDSDKQISCDEFKGAFMKMMSEPAMKDPAPVTSIVVKESEEPPKPDAALDEATETKIKTLFDAMTRGDGQISKIDLVKYCRANDEFVSTFGLDKDGDGKIQAVDKAGLIDLFQVMDGDGDKQVTFDEFKGAFCKMMTA